ncbi:hypothetical protein [Galbibacter orientalis]|uniref:Uncharacterized protein n=1 Tax=Galbibacter orientalis DSM 19592 TaxID=926559 RepID=I3C3C0_9FLAO|nr:hypothetical protein [Galbibacter orientalis]EIJ38113.1 hypothetical protein JoomaDRAFT_1093 [Galbibacter orientalis DSM 19592]
MEQGIIDVLKKLKNDIPVVRTKETTNVEDKAIEKLLAFDIISQNRHQVKLTSKGYKFIDKLINTNKSLEDFNFSEPIAMGITNNFNQVTIGQVNQNTTNSVLEKMNIKVVVESLKEELSEEQLAEIQNIIETYNKPDEQKNKMIEKLKTFGLNVISNIVAGILTNPSLYGM